jgi:hypothetical protein
MTTERTASASPRLKARAAGVLYVLAGTTSALGEFIILGKFVVSGNAATTATNILANEAIYWLGFTVALIAVALHLAWAVLFYDLFRPVNRSLTLLATFFLLVGCTMLAVASLFQIAPLIVLTGRSSLSVLPVEQVQALALTFLNVNAQAYNIFLVFFGFYLLLIGYLIVRSTFLPRLLGVLVAFAGVGYLTLLWPPLADELSPFNLAPAALGEPSLMLWLLLVGVNAQRWKEQAAAAVASLRRSEQALETIL